jgi:hypothetical protein
MARFLRQISLAREAVTASASRTPFDLPVNPLSVVLMRFRVTNAAPAALGTYSALDALITMITDVTIRHNGENIVQGTLRDLMLMNMAYQRMPPGWTQLQKDSGDLRSFVFPICLGKMAFDPKCCFPATQRGNLQMLFTAGALPAAYTAVAISVETYELIEAEPTEYVKYTSRLSTSVVGQFDVRLPIGNPILGTLLFDTGLHTNLTDVTSWGSVKLLKDNVEQYYANADIRVLAGELNRQIENLATWPGHTHQFNGAAAGLADTDEAELLTARDMRGYAYLDFDPLRDGGYILETAGASDLLIRGIGEEATAVRFLPLELVSLKK